MSPLGIVLFGAGAAASIVAGLPLLAAAGVGALVWGGRVAAAVGGSSPTPTARVAPDRLSEPWRGYALAAEEAKRRFDRVVASVAAGPLRDRLTTLSGRLDDGVDESWRIARRGHEIVAAVSTIDTDAAAHELAELRAQGQLSPAKADTARSLEAQLASADRLVALASASRDRLRLLDARFDELLARTVEVSVGTGDSAGLGQDVDGLVTELEALRMAMEETDQAGALAPPTPSSDT